MKRPPFVFASLAALMLIGSPVFAEPDLVYPVKPEALIAILPAASENWKVTRSQGEIALGEWLESRATRVYKFVSQSPEIPSVGQVELRLTDTANFPAALGDFQDFQTGKNGALEKTLIEENPALILPLSESKTLVQILVDNRYLVRLTFSELPKVDAASWLKSLKLDVLHQIKTPSAGELPEEVKLVFLDELQPHKNRAYSVAPPNNKVYAEYLKTLPKEPAESEAETLIKSKDAQ